MRDSVDRWVIPGAVTGQLWAWWQRNTSSIAWVSPTLVSLLSFTLFLCSCQNLSNLYNFSFLQNAACVSIWEGKQWALVVTRETQWVRTGRKFWSVQQCQLVCLGPALPKCACICNLPNSQPDLHLICRQQEDWLELSFSWSLWIINLLSLKFCTQLQSQVCLSVIPPHPQNLFARVQNSSHFLGLTLMRPGWGLVQLHLITKKWLINTSANKWIWSMHETL